jgi:beta-fructofuranosidase
VVDRAGNFYAPNTLLMPKGDRIVWGWIMGFPSGHGWNGCLSLPRKLSISTDGRLLQKPAPQLEKLRGESRHLTDIHLDSSGETVVLSKTNTFELSAEIRITTAKNVSLKLRNLHQASSPIISFDGNELSVMDVKAPLHFSGRNKKLSLRVFVDRSVMEVFANDEVCVTRVISSLDPDAQFDVSADGGAATFKRTEVWPLKTIW